MNPNTHSLAKNRPFFVPGGTLPGDAPSYVTRQADYDLLTGLREGQFCYVLTSRQMGKSSLMVRIAAQLRAEGVAVAILDLTALGQNITVEQWYFGLLEQLGRHLRLEDALDDYWQSHRGLGPLQRWMAAIRDVVLADPSRQIALFVDEIDVVRSLPFSTDEFFAAIRECYNRRATEPSYERLTFCLLGVATPSDLIRDTAMTPFNIGRRIELTDFALKEAEPLSVGISVTGRDGHALLNRILFWTGGQPYLTQRLCNSVAEDEDALREEDVDRLCAHLFLAHKARESNDNLQFVRNRLLKSEVDLTALLDLYSRVRQSVRVPDDEANALTSVLKLSGIVRVERGELKVRNRIYERVFDRSWVQTHLPGAELRRRKAAYRQGLVRAMALSSAVLIALGGLAFYGFSQASRAAANAEMARANAQEAQKQRDTAERSSYTAQMNLVQRDWEIDDFSDATDLLASTERSRYRGFEWGYWNNRLHRERLSLKGHLSYVTSVASSSDGKQIVTGSVDGKAILWDKVYGNKVRTFGGKTGGIWSVACSPDGKQIVTGCGDNVVRVWEKETGREALTLKGHSGAPTAVAFSPDGKWILSSRCSDGLTKVWNAATGQDRLTLQSPKGFSNSAAFSPDSKHIATERQSDTSIWDIVTGRKLITLKGNSHSGTAVAFSPDGRHVATSESVDSLARVWDTTTGRQTLTLAGHKDMITSLAFSPDGKQIVTGSDDRTARIWDAATGQAQVIFKGHTGAVTSVAFSPDGKEIVTGSEDNTARVWEVARQETLTVTEHTGGVYAAAYSPNGQQIVTGGLDSNARVWNATTGKIKFTLKGHTGIIVAAAFSPDGRQIATGSHDNTVILWDALTGQRLRRLNGHKGPVTSVAFSPDGARIATGSQDCTVRLWESRTGEPARLFRAPDTGPMLLSSHGNRLGMYPVAFSPDSKYLLTAGWSFDLLLWDTATGKQRFTLPKPDDSFNRTATLESSAAFSPDGHRIVTSNGDKTARIWDAGTGQLIRTLKGHTSFVSSVAFSPDSKRIVTGSWDTTAKIWDSETGQETLTLKGHTGHVLSAMFSPDGKHILTGSEDATARVWYSDHSEVPKSIPPQEITR